MLTPSTRTRAGQGGRSLPLIREERHVSRHPALLTPRHCQGGEVSPQRGWGLLKIRRWYPGPPGNPSFPRRNFPAADQQRGGRGRANPSQCPDVPCAARCPGDRPRTRHDAPSWPCSPLGPGAGRWVARTEQAELAQPQML